MKDIDEGSDGDANATPHGEATTEGGASRPARARGSRRVAVGVVAVLVVLVAFFGLILQWGADRGILWTDERDVVVPFGETVDQAMIVGSNSLHIQGTVDGDVVVMAEHVLVTGRIRGDLQAMAQEVEVDLDGMVDGTVHCLCETLTMRGEVKRSLHAMADAAELARTGTVGRDALIAATTANLDGTVARDARLYAGTVSVRGEIGRDLQGSIELLTLSPNAKIGRDLDVTVTHAGDVTIDPAARIEGMTRIDEDPDSGTSKYEQPGYYLSELWQFAGAFIVGLLLLGIFPRVMTTPLRGTRGMLRAVGAGLLFIVLVPVAVVILMITIVGIPLGLIMLAGYAIVLYLAQIVAAARLGRAVLRPEREGRGRHAMALFLGLLLLSVATELPWIGWWIAAAIVLVGLGLLYRAVEPQSRRRGRS